MKSEREIDSKTMEILFKKKKKKQKWIVVCSWWEPVLYHTEGRKLDRYSHENWIL